jgi:hypothetical protein
LRLLYGESDKDRVFVSRNEERFKLSKRHEGEESTGNKRQHT